MFTDVDSGTWRKATLTLDDAAHNVWRAAVAEQVELWEAQQHDRDVGQGVE
jgi:hypothetical protein